MKHKFKILNALPLVVFFFIVLSSSVVLYQLKVNDKSERSIASQLIGKNIPKILIPRENYIKRNTNSDNIDFKNTMTKFLPLIFLHHGVLPVE